MFHRSIGRLGKLVAYNCARFIQRSLFGRLNRYILLLFVSAPGVLGVIIFIRLHSLYTHTIDKLSPEFSISTLTFSTDSERTISQKEFRIVPETCIHDIHAWIILKWKTKGVRIV